MPITVAEIDSFIQEVESCDEIKTESYLTNGYHEDLHLSIKKVVDAANELFITSHGTPNYNNINKSKYRITPGEQDGFGWLSGVIKTSKGLIVFG